MIGGRVSGVRWAVTTRLVGAFVFHYVKFRPLVVLPKHHAFCSRCCLFFIMLSLGFFSRSIPKTSRFLFSVLFVFHYVKFRFFFPVLFPKHHAFCSRCCLFFIMLSLGFSRSIPKTARFYFSVEVKALQTSSKPVLNNDLPS